MKKPRTFCLALLLAVMFVPHSSYGQKVTTDWTKGYNFGGLKRFAWIKNNLVTIRHPEDNKILDQKIMRAVTQELASKGIVEDSANPDFYLFYHAGPGTKASKRGSRLPQVSIAYNHPL